MGLAYESQQSINSVPFSVGDSLIDVINEWGEPEDLSTVAANYWSRNVRFLYDGSTYSKKITAIEDFDPKLQSIHLSVVKDLLGTPISEKEQEGNCGNYRTGESVPTALVKKSKKETTTSPIVITKTLL